MVEVGLYPLEGLLFEGGIGVDEHVHGQPVDEAVQGGGGCLNVEPRLGQSGVVKAGDHAPARVSEYFIGFVPSVPELLIAGGLGDECDVDLHLRAALGVEWEQWADGWTVVTKDRSRTAQFEHTLVVTEEGAEVLTLP